MTQISISHPDKVLFKSAGVTKQWLDDYYLKVATPLMQYAKGRPIAFKRYPHGYPGKNFFQKNKPPYAPEWINSIKLGLHKAAEYITPTDIDTIRWLVNREAIEFHTIQSKAPNFMQPDILVFDLDPPTTPEFSLNEQFSIVKKLALTIRPLIESFGYQTFPKTSGKKGIHIFCPVHPKNTYDEVFEAAKEIGIKIVSQTKNTTLKITKSERINKTLIDIYRNHTLQSMSMPYGVRATEKVTVSMPLTWDALAQLESPEIFTVFTVPAYLNKHGDAWAKISEYSVDLHTKKAQ